MWYLANQSAASGAHPDLFSGLRNRQTITNHSQIPPSATLNSLL